MKRAFEWDDGNSDKCLRHGLTHEDVEQVFADLFLLLDDVAHSQAEMRYHAIGRTREGRFALVAFTYRRAEGRALVRPISARYMHRKEIERYERQAPSGPSER